MHDDVQKQFALCHYAEDEDCAAAGASEPINARKCGGALGSFACTASVDTRVVCIRMGESGVGRSNCRVKQCGYSGDT
jgi:hypothetical protein